MEIAQRVIDFGALVIAGFVRDVYIRKEERFNDIDIICEIHKRDNFLEYLNGEFVRTTIPNSSNVPLCRLIDIVYIGRTKLEIMYYDTLEDWKCKESTVDCTHSLFYLSKNGLHIQYLPEGYTQEELLDLILQKKFKHLDERLTTNEKILENIERSYHFQMRGWKLVF